MCVQLQNYPLARNQYINNSPGIFSCIRTRANTGATCIRPEIISLKNLAHMQKMTPQKYFPVFARVRIQAPHVFVEKLIPQEFFPACIGFVPEINASTIKVVRVMILAPMVLIFLPPLLFSLNCGALCHRALGAPKLASHLFGGAAAYAGAKQLPTWIVAAVIAS